MKSSPYPDIAELVPHSGRMVVLDEMTAWSEGEASFELTLSDDSTFVENGTVDSVVTIEYMAQSVAACLGYEAFQHGEGVRVGMVIASRYLDIEIPRLSIGDQLTTHVKRIRGNEQLSHFEGEVRRDGTLVSACNLTVYHAEKPPGDD
jgi:predicted hotdog family 3-hydroxylacyl-ACP dehydratase